MNEKYRLNKKNYDTLNMYNIISNVDYLQSNDENQYGGKKWNLFNNHERKEIMDTFNKISSGDKKCHEYDLKTIKKATTGMFINKNNITDKNFACEYIEDAYDNEHVPIAHEDSMTAWVNNAVENYGLTVNDIINMKFGDRMDVILFDRNISDSVDGFKIGSKFDPKKKGCTYATYIHGDKLTGILDMYEIDVKHVPFTWEINLKAIGHNMFWGPLWGCNSRNKNITDINKLNKNILVGWRGPAIRMSDAKKHLPNYVTHYGTSWDDAVYYKYSNFLKKK